jgi:uncharacterized DUF497 family protein
MFRIAIKDGGRKASECRLRHTKDENLRKNGVTRVEVQEVFASDLYFADDLDPSDHGNDRAMVVGWTQSGRLILCGKV